MAKPNKPRGGRGSNQYRTKDPTHVTFELSTDENRQVDQLIVARSKGTSPRELERLAASADWRIREEVARHPKLPAMTMERLAKDPSGIVRRALAANNVTPSYLLERMVRRFSDDGYGHVQSLAVANNPNADADLLASLLKVKTPVALALAIAQHPNTPTATLGRLVRNPDPAVRLQVAGHPNTATNDLIQLITDFDRDVRAEAARNPTLPSHVKAMWALGQS